MTFLCIRHLLLDRERTRRRQRSQPWQPGKSGRPPMESYFGLALIGLVLVGLVQCTHVSVSRVPTVAWKCASEPPAPIQRDGGFHPQAQGFWISANDTGALTDYVVSLQTAYRSCATVVTEINRMGAKP